VQSLFSSGLPATIRVAALATALSAFGVATVRSVDPISAAIYHTFPFGSHRMYSMTLITEECCGLGRDQLVYNLEFTEFHYILNDVLDNVLHDPDSVLAMHPLANWHVIDAVDRTTLDRSEPSAHTFTPRVVTLADVEKLAAKPDRIFYIELPTMDDASELEHWSATYRVSSPRVYSNKGFKLRVRELALKPADHS
jgi:hypothetical protein